jgi:hypothetical protein
MIWDNVKTAFAERVGEPEMFEQGEVEQEWDSPYFDPDTAEQYLYEAAVDEFLGVKDDMLHSLGALATEEATFTDNADEPAGMIEIIGAAVRVLVTDDFLPATQLSPAKWYEMLSVEASLSSNFAVIAGKIRVKGQAVRLQYKVLPSLEDFQNDSAILPTGYEETIVDRARKLSLLEDAMPRAEY